MADGVKVGSAYVDLTVKSDGSAVAGVVNNLKEIDRVAQTTMQGLQTNFKQTFDAMSNSSRQAFTSWQHDASKYRSEMEQLNKMQKTWAGELKTGLLPPDYMREEEQRLKKFRAEAEKTYQQVKADKQNFMRSFGETIQVNESAFAGFKRAFGKALGDVEGQSHSWGALIAHNVAAPFQRVGDGIAHVFKGVFDKIASMARYAMLGVVGTITATFGGALYKGLERLSGIDEITTKMRFFGADMVQVNTALRDMDYLARSTTFNMVDLGNAATSFLQYGIKSGRDLNIVMQDVADISAATGQGIVETEQQVMRFMSGNTSRMQFQIQSMTSKHVPMLKWIADEMGVTEAAVSKMLSKGEITWEVYEKVVQKHLHGISQAMGHTFKGMMSSLWDSIERLGEAIIKPFFGPMKQGLSGITHWIDGLVEKIKANQPAMVHAAGIIAQAFITAAKGVMQLFSTLTTALSSTLSAAADIAHRFGYDAMANDLRQAAQSIENNVTVPLEKAAIKADQLNQNTAGFFAQLEQSAKLTSAFNDSITNATDENGVTVKDPTAAVIANLDNLQIRLEELKDHPGEFKLIPKTPDAAKLVDDYQRQLGLKPLYLDLEARVSKIQWDGKTTPVPPDQAVHPTNWLDPGASRPGGQAGSNFIPNVLSTAMPWLGGLTQIWSAIPKAIGQYPTEATIQQPVGPYGLVQWAEPSTEGEAFIPLGASNRQRSLDIWAQTGRLLGAFDRGGFRETVSDPSLWWWKWLGKRKSWIYQDNELVRPPRPVTPQRADRQAQEFTLTGMYDQTLPGHIAAPYTTQFSPSAGTGAPPGPGQVNPNYRIDTSNAMYLPGPALTPDVNPASQWMVGDHISPTVLAQIGSSMNPAWQMWWQNQYRTGPGNAEAFGWGNQLRPEGNAFDHKDRHNPLTEGYGPWWGFKRSFWGGGVASKGSWFGGGGGGGGGGYTGVGGIRLWAGEIQRLVKMLFPQIKEIGGYRAHDPYPDHPSGEAVDVMIPGWNTKPGVALGFKVKDFAMRNARPLHVDYAIWRQAMWYPGKGPQGMTDRGSPTQNHFDHVHIRVQRGGGGPDIPGMMPNGRLSMSAGYGMGGEGYRLSGLRILRYPQLPGFRSFAGGGFRWKQNGGDQIGPFPVPPGVAPNAAAAAAKAAVANAAKAVQFPSYPVAPPYHHTSEPKPPEYVDPGTGIISGPAGASMPDDGSGSSSDSSDPSGGNGPYYTPGSIYNPDYFDTGDFMTGPEITPAEAKKLRNAQNKVENLNGRLNIANQQLAELKANPKTKPSAILAKEQEIARLTNDRDNAVDDLNQLQQEVSTNKAGKTRGVRGDGSGMNSALADNPYYKLMQAEQLKQEAYAGIMPDPGELADIGMGGLKESFLPPGFSDPQSWGVTQAASGLLNFLGGIMPDPVSRGLLSMGGAALGGSGSGMANAIRGMIPQPFGSLEIGSPGEAPGIPGYDTSGMPVPGRHLPVGQVPGSPMAPGPANTSGVYNDNRIQVQGDSQTAVTDNTVRTLQKRDAANARRNIGKYARGST